MNTQESNTEFSAPYFNRTMYDVCATERKTNDSIFPMGYQLYIGKYESKSKCTYDKNSFFRPFDLVDAESELKGITRFVTRCPQMKYVPNCSPRSEICYPTKDMPIALNPRLCPPVKNNMPIITDKGF